MKNSTENLFLEADIQRFLNAETTERLNSRDHLELIIVITFLTIYPLLSFFGYYAQEKFYYKDIVDWFENGIYFINYGN